MVVHSCPGYTNPATPCYYRRCLWIPWPLSVNSDGKFEIETENTLEVCRSPGQNADPVWCFEIFPTDTNCPLSQNDGTASRGITEIKGKYAYLNDFIISMDLYRFTTIFGRQLFNAPPPPRARTWNIRICLFCTAPSSLHSSSLSLWQTVLSSIKTVRRREKPPGLLRKCNVVVVPRVFTPFIISYRPHHHSVKFMWFFLCFFHSYQNHKQTAKLEHSQRDESIDYTHVARAKQWRRRGD